ncbi:lipopolysaccharide biosynthesis protein [Acinetobacter courvalinii]|uniref:lipopolysaccharide biosynthesis protein n=1 Tax=Acinetobacter courvalinii TaxID=280147 RepID=UPI0018FF818C|nr:oligosaccharide flippase family protein [Acinetobacter courvalinii]MBJ9958149.1 lipopolysaccharide biosynthesis protein [Acinetobacter courvalinii]
MNLKNIFKLLSGNILAQLITILFIPIITRLFSPADFGQYTLFIAILGFFGVISCLRYEIAISIPERKQDAIHLVVGGSYILIGMVLISSIIVTFAGFLFPLEIGKLGLTTNLKYIPLGLLLLGTYNLLSYYALREKNYSIVAQTKVAQVSFISLSQILFHNFGAKALILGYVIGQTIGSISLFRKFRKDLLVTKISFKRIKELLIEYKNFPLYSTWGAMLNNLGQSVPIILFSLFFGTKIAGLYALSYRLLVVPLGTVSSAVSSYFFSIAREQIANKKIDITIFQIISILSKLSFPFFLLLLFLNKDIYILIFGDKWGEVATFVKILVPWLGCVFVISPISMFMEILEHQGENLIFQIILFMSRALAITYGLFNKDIIFVLSLFSAVSVLCWVALLMRILVLSQLKIGCVLLEFFKNLLISLILLLPLIFYSLDFFPGNYFFYLIITLFFILCYYVWILKGMRKSENVG